MVFHQYSKADVTFMKGGAILLIIIHNFMHRFPFPKENEMYFDPDVITNFVDIFVSEPSGSIRASFSFLGHFGVQIFVFFSAYGLGKKYLFQKVVFKDFIVARLRKIYPVFIMAIIFYIIYIGGIKVFFSGAGIEGYKYFFLHNYKAIILKLTLLWNLYPEQGFSLVGPWWFLSMIFQFYLIFPLISVLKNRYGDIVLLSLSVFSLIIVYICKGDIYGVSIYFTVIGHMPLLCLGLYSANIREIQLNNFILPALIILFILGNYYSNLFYLTHISFFFILIFIFNFLLKRLSTNSMENRFFSFFGKISMPLFLVNGFIRYPLERIAHKINNEFYTLFLCIVFVLFAVIASLLLNKATEWLTSLLYLKYPPKKRSN